MLRQIDDLIYDAPVGIQRDSEWVEYYLYINHVTQARVAIVLGCVPVIVKFFNEFSISGDNVSIWIVIAVLSLMINSMFATFAWEELLNFKARLNIYRQDRGLMVMRLLMLTVSLWAVFFTKYQFLEIAFVPSGALAMYLLGCQPLPPGAHKKLVLQRVKSD